MARYATTKLFPKEEEILFGRGNTRRRRQNVVVFVVTIGGKDRGSGEGKGV